MSSLFDKKNLLVSVSGGRSSMYMANQIKNRNWHLNFNIAYVFANTGKEREETLQFVERCDKEWGLEIIWVEAVVHTARRGCTHKVVDFETASRHGEPFEEVIKKYGIPNQNYLHCTRELKANPIRSLTEMLGWDYFYTAQGIRVDEPKRIGNKSNVIYPLYDWFPATKGEVLDWWKDQPFDLGLEEHQGNCDACHKKSINKLVRIAKETPSAMMWWEDIGQRYANAGHNIDGNPRKFFRGQITAGDILNMALMMTLPPLPDPEEDAGCSESCEAFA